MVLVLIEPGHINNLYNTTFWTMVQKGGMSNTDAERELQVCAIVNYDLLHMS